MAPTTPPQSSAIHAINPVTNDLPGENCPMWDRGYMRPPSRSYTIGNEPDLSDRDEFIIDAIRRNRGGLPMPTGHSRKNLSPTRCKRKFNSSGKPRQKRR